LQQVQYETKLPFTAEKVWTLLADFGSILDWLPSGNDNSTITLVGEGVGMLRDLDMPSVGKVQHRLDRLDHNAMTTTYSLTKGAPLGMVDYQVSVSVVVIGDEQCRLNFHGEFEGHPSADITQMARNLEGAYSGMGKGIEAFLNRM